MTKTTFITVPMPEYRVPSLPPFVVNMLNKHFTPSQVSTLCHSWYTYSQLSFGSSSEHQILREARWILKLNAQANVPVEQRYANNRLRGHALVTWFCATFGAPVEGWRFQGHEDWFVTLTIGPLDTRKYLKCEQELSNQLLKAGAVCVEVPYGQKLVIDFANVEIIRCDSENKSKTDIRLSNIR